MYQLQSCLQPTTKRPLPASPDPLGSDRGKHRATTQCCFAWNQGKYQYPRCMYRHVLLHCSGDHPMLRCATLSQDKESRSARNARPRREGPSSASRVGYENNTCDPYKECVTIVQMLFHAGGCSFRLWAVHTLLYTTMVNTPAGV